MSTAYRDPRRPATGHRRRRKRRPFPVRRIWCVGRNYLEHIRELGNDERQPPFFFSKQPDMIEARRRGHPVSAA